MLLKDLVNQLNVGVLNNASVGLDSDLSEEKDNYDIILPHLNSALSQVYTALHLKENYVDIILDETIVNYYLHNKYSKSNNNSTEPIKYIDDLDRPYLNDCLKITAIADNDGNILKLNDLGVKYPIWLTTPKAFRINSPITGDKLTVHYKATHPYLNIETINPETTEIDIPYFALDVLMYCIAYRVYAAFPSMSDGVNQSIYFEQKYEKAINDLRIHNLASEEPEIHDKFRGDGWV